MGSQKYMDHFTDLYITLLKDKASSSLHCSNFNISSAKTGARITFDALTSYLLTYLGIHNS